MPNKTPKANKVSVSGLEDQPITIVLSGSDADGSISSYSLTALPSNGVLYLDASLTQVANVNVAYTSNTFYFLPSANFSGTANFSYAVKDNQGAVSAPAGVSLAVSSVNDAPVLDLNGSTAGSSVVTNYSVNGAATLIAPTAIVADIDSANFGGGSLKVAVAQTASTDQLSIVTDATVSVSGGNVFVSGVKIGTILAGHTGSNGSDLTINLLNGATSSSVSILLDHIAYSNSSANPASLTRTVQFSLVDGDSGADTGVATATINILAPNRAPTGSVTISGTPTEDATLTASNSLADADGIGAVTYQWLRNGNDTGATGSTYVLSDADVGAQISVRASYTDLRGMPETVTSTATAAIANVNDAPTGSVTISGTPTEDATLTASNTLADADGIGAITYQWLRNGSDTGATGSTYVLSDADVAAQISVRASYTDLRGMAETVTSTATAAIANVNDMPLVNGSTILSAITEDSGARIITQAELLGNSLDVDGPSLTAINLSISAGAGSLIYNGNGTWRFISALNDDSSVTFAYEVTDGIAAPVSAVASLDILPFNDAPIIHAPTIVDIITANIGSNNVSILTGNGSDQFLATVISTPNASSNAAPALADVNGDGIIDILTANAGSSNVSVLLGNGLGDFTETIANIAGGLNPSHLVVGDLNDDGYIDVVTANSGSDDVSILLGDGSGNFNASVRSIGGGVGPVSVALGDMDGDGNLDIVTANTNSNNVSVLLGDGLGGFTASVTTIPSISFSVAVADLNHDGLLDVVTANQTVNTVSVLLGDGQGGFNVSTTGVGGGLNAQSVAIGDLNGDGNLDIVTANLFSNDVSVLLGDGFGNFIASVRDIGGGVAPWTAVLADINGDGNLDIATANNASNNVSILLGDGLGGFTASLSTVAALGPISLAVGDLNHRLPVVEDSTLVFSVANGNAITVADIDAFSDSEIVTLTAAHGNLLIANAAGLTVTGDGSNSVMLAGSVAAINVALDGLSYLPTADFSGADTLTISAYDTGNLSSTRLVPITVTSINDAPTGSVTISGTPTEDATLTASNTLADADGIGAITYHWLRGGVDIGMTGSSYVLGDADVGAQISVRANYTDARGAAEAVSSAQTATVANVNDAPTGAVTISEPFEGNIIEINGWFTQQYQATEGADYFVFDVNHPDSPQPDGAQIFGFDPTMDYIVLENFDEPHGERSPYNNGFSTGTVVSDGHYLTVYPWSNGDEVFIDAAEGPDQYSSPRIWSVGVSAETFYDNNLIITSGEFTPGMVTISGTPTEDATLTASNSLADADGIGAITYQWLRNGSDTGATGSTYVLGDADVGAHISVRATYTDARGTAEAVTSSATAAIANVNDAPTGSVTISGTPTEDQMLTLSSTLVDGDGIGATTYNWLRGGVDTGVTGTSYLLGDDDVGAQISVRATYTDTRGAAEAVTSSATTAVANVNDAPTGLVTISGTPTEDQTLTASNTIGDADGLTSITYHWLRNGVDDGAVGSTYLLSDADVGAQISVRATYTDARGTAEAVTSGVTAAIANLLLPTEIAFLTALPDVLPASNIASTLVGTSSTLNPSDKLDGGGGVDTLLIFGGGAVHLNTLTQFDGFEVVNLNNLGNPYSWDLYLRDDADLAVTIGSADTGVGNLDVHLGANATTTVNTLGNAYYANYFLSSGTADISTADNNYTEYTNFNFSTGNATIHAEGIGRYNFNLSSGAATVYGSTDVVGSNWYGDQIRNSYYLSSGAYDLHGSNYGYDNFVISNPSQLESASVIDGATGFITNPYDSSIIAVLTDTLTFSGTNQIYDLTVPHNISISNLEAFNIDSGNTLKVDTSSLAGISSVGGLGTLATDAASLDLSNISVQGPVTSQNSAGTTFTVTTAYTAAHIMGGSGQDSIIAQGFTFTDDQRNSIFVQSSVDTLVDSSGTYISPTKLTVAPDTIVGSFGDDAVLGTSSTLNPSDKLDGGGGVDTLLMFGGGAVHLNTLTQFDGFEVVNLNNLGNPYSWDLYLRDDADLAVTIGSADTGVGNLDVHLGANATTTVNTLGNAYYANYFLSSGTADISTADNNYTEYTNFNFSTGNATIHAEGIGRYNFNLSSGAATVYGSTDVVGSNWYGDQIRNSYYLSSGAYDLHGSNYGYDNFVISNPSQLESASVIDGATGFITNPYDSSIIAVLTDTLTFSGTNQIYDLTVPHNISISNLEAFNIDSGNTLKVDTSSLAGISSVGGLGTLATDAASLDLSNISVQGPVTSQNSAGTTFTVTTAYTAAHIMGGSGQDSIIAQGFTFTDDQRNSIFVQSSVDTLVDSSGTYISPTKLTVAPDTIVGSFGDDAVLGTSSTLNPSDKLDGGGGVDTLLMFGGGAVHLNTLTQFDGFEVVNLNNLGNPYSWDLYLRDDADLAVTIGSADTGVGNLDVHLGANATTTVNTLGNAYYANYFLSSGTADISTADNNYTEYTNFNFSTGNATIHAEGIGRYNFNLSSGAATVYGSTDVVGSNWYGDQIRNSYYLSSGAYDLHGSNYGYDNFVISNPSQLESASVIDGATGFITNPYDSSIIAVLTDTLTFSGTNQIYDLTVPHNISISNLEAFNIDSGNTLKVDTSSLAGISSVGGLGTLATDAASLDLSNISVQGPVTSQNSAGTTFTVTTAYTAAHIMGGSGQDSIIAQGFTFTDDQRNSIFVQSSVDVIKDDTGVYGNASDNTLEGFEGGSLAGGGGSDTFVFDVNWGQQTINDFQIGIDDINIDASLFSSIQSILDSTHDDFAGNAVITYDEANTVTLVGVSRSTLLANQSDLHLV